MPKSQRKEAILYNKDEEYKQLMGSTNDKELQNAFKAYKSWSLNAAQFKPSMKTLIKEYLRLKNELQVQSREEVDMDIVNDEEEEMEDRFEKMRELKENAEAANETLKKQVQDLQEKVEELQAGSGEMDVVKASLAATVNESEQLEKEVESLREELEKQKTDFEKEKAAMVKDVERLNKEVETLKNAHGTLSTEKDRLAKHASECQQWYNGFIKDLGDMIREANTVLGVKQEEEPTTVAQTLEEFYLKFKEVLKCLSNSKSKVESQKKSILDLNGTIASKQDETTAAQNELSEERWDRQLLLQWIETVNQWLEYGEDGTEDEERVRFSKVDTIPAVKALLLFSGYNPESKWKRPKPLQE
ncbi:hypothetical protein CAEBREN_25244 [Caenorhabditis brenneri]|uniref:Uncharacterized protein n=1 Tax=Caenorhabditis brenneri TaxID=135651 RepID=G0PBQ6_CAEBE|nr:hypothetical protein CAEBREN_25244 [Caenorhabditis brenneri]